MDAVVSMLRGVNLAGHRRIKMDDLRAVHESLACRDVQTYVQSGNVVFRTGERDMAQLTKRIENAIERKFGFHSDAVLRTCGQLREVIRNNPFAGREDVHPSKLLVTFLAADPGDEARERVRKIKADPEELHVHTRELYIYFPNGMARPKLSSAALDRALKMTGTARNWNTVTKLLEMAEKLEGL